MSPNLTPRQLLGQIVGWARTGKVAHLSRDGSTSLCGVKLRWSYRYTSPGRYASRTVCCQRCR